MALFTGMYVVELHVANSLQTDAEDYFKVNRPEAWLIIDRPRVLWVLIHTYIQPLFMCQI